MRLKKTSLCVLLACSLTGCGDSSPPKSGPRQAPAKVEKHPSESDIYRVTLTPKAAERLGITTAKVERKATERWRTLGGEVLVPSGNAISVTAPITGTLGAAPEGSVPSPGSRVGAGQTIFSLIPILSPDRDVPTPAERVQMANAQASLVSAQIIAGGDVKQAQVEVDAARVALTRAERLLQDRAGSRRVVDEANAVLEIAREKLKAAQTRKSVFDSLTLDAEKGGELRTVQIVTPKGGVLRNLTAARGQMVTAGTPLFEVVNLDTVWIRVPVFVGQLDQIVAGSDAKIGGLKGGLGPGLQTAKPITAPPSADPLASTVDLYYEVPNRGGALHPGERVGVTLPLKGESENLVVPWHAVLYDIHGTAWVYEQAEARVFRRRRVLVRYTIGDQAVLASGPEVGTEIVVDGVAELFGTEFGSGK